MSCHFNKSKASLTFQNTYFMMSGTQGICEKLKNIAMKDKKKILRQRTETGTRIMEIGEVGTERARRYSHPALHAWVLFLHVLIDTFK